MSALAAEAVEGLQQRHADQQRHPEEQEHTGPDICDVIRHHVASLKNGRLKLVANLPYSVATPVIANIIASDLPWERMVCTIQWELAEKMEAEPAIPNMERCRRGFSRREHSNSASSGPECVLAATESGLRDCQHLA
jgi:hypothetical protein